MKFAVRQAVAVPPARAMAAYGSPAFYEGRPARDDIAVREVVRHEAAGDRILLEVRFAFTGSVSPAVRAVVDPGKMSWITRTEILPGRGALELGRAARPLPGPAERQRHLPLRGGRRTGRAAPTSRWRAI